MAFDWAEYVEVAKALIDAPFAPCDEGKYRAALSRSYYAAYCLTHTCHPKGRADKSRN